jgi:hypothetical protein
MHKYIIIFLFLSINLNGQGQAVSHLYSMDYEMEEDSFSISSIQFLSDFNKQGFNGNFDVNDKNQIIYSANANLNNINATELVLLDLEDSSLEILTNNNKQDDYPRFIGNSTYIQIQKAYNESILAIRSVSNAIQAERILSSLSNINTAINLDNDAFILNLISDLNYLAVAYESDSSFKILEANVGPKILKFSDTQFFYVHKVRPDYWLLKRYDLEYLKKKSVSILPIGIDQFDMFPDGSFLIGKGSKLFRFNPLISEDWIEIDDLSEFGIYNISQVGIGQGVIVISNIPE